MFPASRRQITSRHQNQLTAMYAGDNDISAIADKQMQLIVSDRQMKAQGLGESLE